MKNFSSLKYHFGMKLHSYPNYEARAITKKNSDIMRYYYNYQLGIDKYIADMFEYYGADKLLFDPLYNHWLNDMEAKRRTSYAKSQHAWLNDKKIDCFVPNMAYRHEHLAKKNYHKGLQHHARFHSKRAQGSKLVYQTCFSQYKRKDGSIVRGIYIIDRRHVYIKRLGGRIKVSEIPSRVWRVFKDGKLRIGTVTVSRDNLGVYHLSFALASDESFINVPVNKTGCKLSMLAYDLNISNFLYDSNGHEVNNPKYYEKKAEKLEWLQHQLSRKYRHNKSRVLSKCSNYQSNRKHLAKVSKHVYHQRDDFLNNLSVMTVENQDFIAGESLESSNMLQNHKVAKHIQSVGWIKFIGLLAQKTDEYHKIYVLVNPYDTTQRCSRCGYVCNYKDHTHIRLGVEYWVCPHCGKHHIRDRNAAVNILYSAIIAIQKYLPKHLRLHLTDHDNSKDKDYFSYQDMQKLRLISTSANTKNIVPAWLKYLATHYCGVIDSAKPSVANLNTFHSI